MMVARQGRVVSKMTITPCAAPTTDTDTPRARIPFIPGPLLSPRAAKRTNRTQRTRSERSGGQQPTCQPFRRDMAMSATLGAFAKRYSAKYIQTGSFSPVIHFMGVSALTHLSIKYVVVGQHKSEQKKETAKKVHDFYDAHHAGAH